MLADRERRVLRCLNTNGQELVCLLLSKKITRINLNAFRPIGRGATQLDLAANHLEVRSAVFGAWKKTYPE